MDWRQTHFDETGRPRAGRHDWPPDLALERIEAISQNARATWFALLGLLTFVMVTLLGVEDIDFFGYDRQTQLPLVGVSVPTDLFFYTAPVLTAAVYAYFHFYLMKLWDALGRAPARIGNDALGDRIHPWLVSDAALLLRAKEGAAPNRALRYISAITSSALTWGYGWFVLGYAWAISFPAHDLKMSALLCAVFAFSLWIGLTSLVFVWRRVRRRDFSERSHLVWRRWTWWAPAAAVVAFGMYFTVGKTFGAAEAAIWVSDAFSEEETEKQTKERHARAASHAPNWPELSRANLFEAHLTEKPADWLDRDTAERQARKAWCSRRNLDWAYCVKQPEDWQQARRASWCAKRKIEDCDGYFTEHEKDFQFEWLTRREDYLSVLRKPDLTGRDLRGADLEGAFLPAVDLAKAKLQGANLAFARLEAALLDEAVLDNGILFRARLENIEAGSARFKSADLRWARLTDATLHLAIFSGADLSRADLSGAVLRNAILRATDLRLTKLSDADLEGATLENAILRSALSERANLGDANLTKADMRGIRLDGSYLGNANLYGANLMHATLRETVLDNVSLEGAYTYGTSFEGAFLKQTKFGAANLRAANFARSIGLTQFQLDQSIGNAETTLPRDQQSLSQLYLWSCWEQPPSTFETLLSAVPSRQQDEAREAWLCNGKPRRRTGRTECGVEITDDNWDKPELLKCPEE